jgi:ATP-dependent Lon protease
VPDNVKQAVEIVPVRWIDKVLEEALVSKPTPLELKKDKEVVADVVAQAQDSDSGEPTTAGGHCNC